VGTVTAASPLLPIPLSGQAYLTGTPFGPKLALLFPPPNALKLVGTVNLSTHTVTFTGVPDVPQTSLVVTLLGGRNALENATCAPPSGTASASFTGQNGKVVNVSQAVVVSGCPASRPGRPAISNAGLSGLARGKPVLRFRLTKASGGPKLKSFTVSLPRGLSFNPHAGRHGLSVAGVKSAVVRGGKLIVTLRRAANAASVKLASPLLVAKQHRLGHVNVQVAVADAAGRTIKLTAAI